MYWARSWTRRWLGSSRVAELVGIGIDQDTNLDPEASFPRDLLLKAGLAEWNRRAWRLHHLQQLHALHSSLADELERHGAATAARCVEVRQRFTQTKHALVEAEERAEDAAIALKRTRRRSEGGAEAQAAVTQAAVTSEAVKSAAVTQLEKAEAGLEDAKAGWSEARKAFECAQGELHESLEVLPELSDLVPAEVPRALPCTARSTEQNRTNPPKQHRTTQHRTTLPRTTQHRTTQHRASESARNLT